jgi:hypothetical protein
MWFSHGWRRVGFGSLRSESLIAFVLFSIASRKNAEGAHPWFFSKGGSWVAQNPPRNCFRISTYISLSKHTTYNPCRIRTYKPNTRRTLPKPLCSSHLQKQPTSVSRSGLLNVEIYTRLSFWPRPLPACTHPRREKHVCVGHQPDRNSRVSHTWDMSAHCWKNCF